MDKQISNDTLQDIQIIAHKEIKKFSCIYTTKIIYIQNGLIIITPVAE